MSRKEINIREELVADIREFKAPELASRILKAHKLGRLVELALEKDQMLSSRAMWVLGHCSDLDQHAIVPFHSILIENLKNKNLHNGVIRNTLRLFRTYPVPDSLQAFMLDVCYGYIKNPQEAIAVRAFAITVVYQVSRPYKELLRELKEVLMHLNPTEESPGMRSRIKNTLKDLKKITDHPS